MAPYESTDCKSVSAVGTGQSNSGVWTLSSSQGNENLGLQVRCARFNIPRDLRCCIQPVEFSTQPTASPKRVAPTKGDATGKCRQTIDVRTLNLVPTITASLTTAEGNIKEHLGSTDDARAQDLQLWPAKRDQAFRSKPNQVDRRTITPTCPTRKSRSLNRHAGASN